MAKFRITKSFTTIVTVAITLCCTAITASYAANRPHRRANNRRLTTCPVVLERASDGYWISNHSPGWRSDIKTKKNITINTHQFGGAVYSPKHQRIACVYRRNDNRWIALISRKRTDIRINRNARDDNGKQAAWRFNKQQQDYACGRPNSTNLRHCTFYLTRQQPPARQRNRQDIARQQRAARRQSA